MIPFILLLALIGVGVYCYWRFIHFHQERRRGGEGIEFLPWAAVGITLLVTLIVWFQDNRNSSQQVSDQFSDNVSKVQDDITSRSHAYEELLSGARDLLASQPRFDASAVADYVRSLQLEQKHPHIGGMGFIAYVPESAKNRFIALGRRHHDGAFQLTPSGGRSDYFVVDIAEPAGRLRNLIGYDLASDPDAKTALEAAQNRTDPTLSHRLSLPDDPTHSAFLYLLPVYRRASLTGVADGEIEGARSGSTVSEMKGWVFARFRADEFLKNIVHEQPPTLELQVFDGMDGTKATLFFDSFGTLDRVLDGSSVITKSMEIAGHTWTLHFVPRGAGGSSDAPSHRALAVLSFGALISLASFVLLGAMRSGLKRANVLAREMTADLEHRNAILSNGPDGVVIVDAQHPDMPIIWINSRFERMTGYNSHEALGKNCRFLQGGDREQKGLTELRRALRDQREAHVTLRNYKRDGTPFWNELTVAPVRGQFGRITQFVGHLRDVTEREQAERRLATQVAIIRALSESPTIEEAAARLLEALCEGQEWELGVFWELDARSQVLRCVEIWHQPEINIIDFERFCRDTTFPREMGLPGHVWAKGEAVWFGDMEKEDKFPETPILIQQGLVSACGFPIVGRRGLQGVLTFYSRKIWPLNKNLLLLMVTTGNQISQFMERQQNQGQQREVAALERGLAEFMGDGLVAMDREGYCIYANSAAGKLLGYGATMMVGQNLHDLLHPKDAMDLPCDMYRCPVLQSLQSTQPCHIEDHQVFYTRDRVPVPVAYTTAPIIDQGLIRGVVITMNDVTLRRQVADKLENLLREKENALQDALRAADEMRRLTSPREEPAEVVAPVQEAAPAPEVIALPPRKPMVLLVEEDAGARERLGEPSPDAPYEFLKVGSAGEAMAHAERAPETIDLLIADCILTGMSGKALFARLTALNSQIRVLFLSTYTQAAIEELGLLPAETPFLQKPFTPEALAAKIGELLA